MLIVCYAGWIGKGCPSTIIAIVYLCVAWSWSKMNKFKFIDNYTWGGSSKKVLVITSPKLAGPTIL